MSGEARGISDAADGDAGPRRRGRPRQLSLERIASAARKVAPEALTMQAVADELGVDPKALNYHVGDREGLRELVALDIFETELARVALPVDREWREVVRSYAVALRDAVVQVGVLASSVRLSGARGLGTLAPVERVLEALVGAGFDIHDARIALTLITETSFSSGMHAVLLAQHRVHPDVPGVLSALETVDERELPVLREVIADQEADDDQLDFKMTVILDGLDRLLIRKRVSG
ncbi:MULTISPECIES: TetR family transcriptional regulator [Nocardia]|uniref:TetR/AcrR family transcriptional regulator C-terminal domain-containing protein n=1 Tax=Nocardia TaxID=1817 RepID=UPI000D688D24|nr:MULTISPECIES: TetR/AcrR family transcriptional regulator C-terminal domain-containing protein [Nocardia]